MARMKTVRFIVDGRPVDAKGKNKNTITRRMFGDSAKLTRNWDRNSPYKYNVVQETKYGTRLLGQVQNIEDYEGSTHQHAVHRRTAGRTKNKR